MSQLKNMIKNNVNYVISSHHNDIIDGGNIKYGYDVDDGCDAVILMTESSVCAIITIWFYI